MILAFSHLHDELKYGNEGGEETMLNVSTPYDRKNNVDISE